MSWQATVAASRAVVTNPAEPTDAPPSTAQSGSDESVRKKLANASTLTSASARRPGMRHSDTPGS